MIGRKGERNGRVAHGKQKKGEVRIVGKRLGAHFKSFSCGALVFLPQEHVAH